MLFDYQQKFTQRTSLSPNPHGNVCMQSYSLIIIFFFSIWPFVSPIFPYFHTFTLGFWISGLSVKKDLSVHAYLSRFINLLDKCWDIFIHELPLIDFFSSIPSNWKIREKKYNYVILLALKTTPYILYVKKHGTQLFRSLFWLLKYMYNINRNSTAKYSWAWDRNLYVVLFSEILVVNKLLSTLLNYMLLHSYI